MGVCGGEFGVVQREEAAGAEHPEGGVVVEEGDCGGEFAELVIVVWYALECVNTVYIAHSGYTHSGWSTFEVSTAHRGASACIVGA